MSYNVNVNDNNIDNNRMLICYGPMARRSSSSATLSIQAAIVNNQSSIPASAICSTTHSSCGVGVRCRGCRQMALYA